MQLTTPLTAPALTTLAWTVPAAPGKRGTYIARGTFAHGQDAVDKRNKVPPDAEPAPVHAIKVTPEPLVQVCVDVFEPSVAHFMGSMHTCPVPQSVAEALGLLVEGADDHGGQGGEDEIELPTPSPEAQAETAEHLAGLLAEAPAGTTPAVVLPQPALVAVPVQATGPRGGRKGDRKPGAKLRAPLRPEELRALAGK